MVGILYLVWMWFAVGLNKPERLNGLLKTGRIPEHVV
jgi:hypothetical protein